MADAGRKHAASLTDSGGPCLIEGLPQAIVDKICSHLASQAHRNAARCTCRALREGCRAAERGAPLGGALRDLLASAALAEWAVRSGGLVLNGLLKWQACEHAAVQGCLDALQWARDHGCPWHAGVCAAAAYGGHLEVIQWARANGCPWDKRTCTFAAFGGHLHVLLWAQAHGCPTDAGTAAFARRPVPVLCGGRDGPRCAEPSNKRFEDAPVLLMSDSIA
eukprot:CAMPEP_0206005178 /NCGR_PEP_ID=MMETSP1464-20131121/4416_1 /ASSEMBLY_ACC=CAM_ASM_001124 /TAXON_ID=119497 /ORGANISM="Exanthemachrysis gayraliae, Strain RCC1523" /LENGTH=220 /DNA_ID=CAMNT_0053378605 /DNA_START=64 /DNA_END=726 /DNA_ORIENTATION=+